MPVEILQDSLSSVKQFNCQGCGASLEALHPRAKYVACQYCGSVLDANSEEHEILAELGKPSKYEPFSFIKLGMLANFNGKRYQVIARTRWISDYKEYWSEEGETGYSDEIWHYDEWLMLADDYTYFYLIEDKESFYISEEIVPETPSLLPSNLKMRFFEDQYEQIVREFGESQVAYFEGESNYTIKTGDRAQFAMFKDRRLHYTSEWRLDDDGEIKEVEFFKETPIARMKILEAFEQNEEIAKLRQVAADRKFIRRIASYAFLSFVLFWLYAMFTNGEQVASINFDLSNVSEEKSIVSGPIQIDETGLYAIDVRTDLYSNNEIFALAYLLDKDSIPLNRISGNFYYWTGFDDEGSWTESDQKESIKVRITETGTYYAQLFVSKSGETGQVVTNPGNLTLVFRRGIILGRYFFFAALLSLVVMIVFRKRRI